MTFQTEQGRLGTVEALDLASGRRESMAMAPGSPAWAWDWLPEVTGVVATALDPLTWAREEVVVYSLGDGTRRSLGRRAAAWLSAHPDSGVMVAADDSLGLLVLPLDGGEVSRGQESGGQLSFSPDGRWLAFLADDGLRVTRYPFAGRSSRLSEGRVFEQPSWAPDGSAIYYKGPSEFWRVSFAPTGGADGGPAFGPPELFSHGPYVRVFGWTYDIAPDGRIIVVVGPPEQSVDRIEVVTGFFEELERLDPTRGAGR